MMQRLMVVGLMAIILCGSTARAQDANGTIDQSAPREQNEPIPAERAGSPWRWTLDLYGRYGFKADLDTTGDLTTTRLGAILGVGTRLENDALLRFNLRFESSSYDFNNADALGAGDDGPLDEGYDISLRPVYIQQIDDKWGWLVSPFIRFSGEKDVSLGDAILFGGFAGVSHRFSETFNLTLGIGAEDRFEDDALVIPYIAFQWTPSETTTVESDGLGVNVTRRLDDEWAVRLFGRWEPRDYRLDEDGPIPGGVMRDDEVLIGAALVWTPSQRATLNLTLGATVYREIESLNDSGITIAREQVDPAPFVGFRFDWVF